MKVNFSVLKPVCQLKLPVSDILDGLDYDKKHCNSKNRSNLKLQHREKYFSG
jgi:hypothetical protein